MIVTICFSTHPFWIMLLAENFENQQWQGSDQKGRPAATCSDTEELLAAATVQCDAKAPAK
jgi:hypothetical protein